MEPADISGRLVEAEGGKVELIASERGRWLAYYENVRASVQTDALAPVPADEAVATLEVIEAARRSSREGRRIHL